MTNETTSAIDLVERLKRRVPVEGRPFKSDMTKPLNPDGPEAADTITRLQAAMTPSAETKAAYIGEFRFSVELSHPRLGSEFRSVEVPWTTIKEIMAAIREHASSVGGGVTP